MFARPGTTLPNNPSRVKRRKVRHSKINHPQRPKAAVHDTLFSKRATSMANLNRSTRPPRVSQDTAHGRHRAGGERRRCGRSPLRRVGVGTRGRGRASCLHRAFLRAAADVLHDACAPPRDVKMFGERCLGLAIDDEGSRQLFSAFESGLGDLLDGGPIGLERFLTGQGSGPSNTVQSRRHDVEEAHDTGKMLTRQPGGRDLCGTFFTAAICRAAKYRGVPRPYPTQDRI